MVAKISFKVVQSAISVFTGLYGLLEKMGFSRAFEGYFAYKLTLFTRSKELIRLWLILLRLLLNMAPIVLRF